MGNQPVNRINDSHRFEAPGKYRTSFIRPAGVAPFERNRIDEWVSAKLNIILATLAHL